MEQKELDNAQKFLNRVEMLIWRRIWTIVIALAIAILMGLLLSTAGVMFYIWLLERGS